MESTRWSALLCAALFGCASSAEPQPRAAGQAEELSPNERYHAVEACGEHALAPGRVRLEVAIDQEGKPLDALVTPVGGTVRSALTDCVRTRLLTQRYEPRGKAVTLIAVVDLRLGNYSTAGSPMPVPPGY